MNDTDKIEDAAMEVVGKKGVDIFKLVIDMTSGPHEAVAVLGLAMSYSFASIGSDDDATRLLGSIIKFMGADWQERRKQVATAVAAAKAKNAPPNSGGDNINQPEQKAKGTA